MSSQEPEQKKPPKKYTLTGAPVWTNDEYGKKVLQAIDITTVHEGKPRTIRYPATRDEAETTIGLLIPGIQKGINAFHALMKGEHVALGTHTVEELLEYGLPFEDLEP